LNINTIDDTHHVPLLLFSNMQIAELLIDAGTDVNAKTQRDGANILHAVAKGSF